MNAVSAGACDPVSIIERKRDGGELTDAQIRWAVGAHLRGDFADPQMSALLMAIVLRGMTRRETAALESAMRRSGARKDLSGLALPTVDKHSTGGVGDKITLVLAPLIAACGAAVPQVSGRALGHTGGTLDKLESVPGWSAQVAAGDFERQLRDVGAVVCAASADLAPADRRMYALRDVTGTVESVPLIAASIMSKKLAEGAGALVLDVKAGSGAFMRDGAAARELARTMVGIGADAGVHTTALITAMDAPLGRRVGNAPEVAEAVEVLAGGGPPDVRELTLALAAEMLVAAGLDGADPADLLDDGTAMDRWRAMIRAQGGEPEAPLPEPRHREQLRVGDLLTGGDPLRAGGELARLDARAVGEAARILGAGRRVPGEDVQAAAGIEVHAKPGDRVRAGDVVLTLCTDDPARLAPARAALAGAAAFVRDGGPAAEAGAGAGTGAAGSGPLILGRVG